MTWTMSMSWKKTMMRRHHRRSNQWMGPVLLSIYLAHLTSRLVSSLIFCSRLHPITPSPRKIEIGGSNLYVDLYPYARGISVKADSSSVTVGPGTTFPNQESSLLRCSLNRINCNVLSIFQQKENLFVTSGIVCPS